MRGIAILTACLCLAGCAAAPPAAKVQIIEEPVSEPSLPVTNVSALEDGTVNKLRGVAYIHDAESGEFILLLEGEIIPIGKVFYLTPKTTMRIEQKSGDEIYLYSKEKEEYFRLVTGQP